MSISINQEDLLCRFDDLASRVAWMEETYQQRHLEDNDRIQYLEDESQRLNTCNIHLQSSLMAIEERMLRIIDSIDLITTANNSNTKQLNSVGVSNNTTNDINSIGSSSRNGIETQNDINSLYKLAGKSLKAQKQVFEELSIIRQALVASKQLDPNPSFPLQQTIIENYKKNQDGNKQIKEDTRNGSTENKIIGEDQEEDTSNIHGNTNGYLDTQNSQQYEHNPIHRLFGREEQQKQKNDNNRYRIDQQSNYLNYNNSQKQQENNNYLELPQEQSYQGQLSSQTKLSRNHHKDQLFTFTENNHNNNHQQHQHQQPLLNNLNNSSYENYLRNSQHNQPFQNSGNKYNNNKNKFQENSFETQDFEILHQRKSKNGSVLDYTIQYHDNKNNLKETSSSKCLNRSQQDRQLRQSRSGSLQSRNTHNSKVHLQAHQQNNNNLSIDSGKRNINSECKRKKKSTNDKETIRGSSGGGGNNNSSSKKAIQRQSLLQQSNSHQKQHHHQISEQQVIFRNTPFGTEKSREKEIQSRLQLERRIKDEKIQLLEGIARQSPNRYH